MEPGLTFIVRLYRRQGSKLTGIVEEAGSGRRIPIASAEELWWALSRNPQPAARTNKSRENR
jgi:hypothetical protein